MSNNHDAIMGTTKLYFVDPKQIVVRDNWNPRTDFEHLYDWMESVRRLGVQRPIEVKLNTDTNKIELIAGESRLRAVLTLLKEGVKEAENGTSLEKIPAIKIPAHENEKDTYLRMLTENSHTPLNPIDQAKAFAYMKDTYNMSYADIAKHCGVSFDVVSERFRLLKADPELQEAVRVGAVTKATAIGVLQQHGDDPQQQRALAQQARKSPEGAKQVKRQTQQKIDDDKETPHKPIGGRKSNADLETLLHMAEKMEVWTLGDTGQETRLAGEDNNDDYLAARTDGHVAGYAAGAVCGLKAAMGDKSGR